MLSPRFSHTPLCQRLGLRVPIIQAGMGGVAGGALAGAVSAAGGLGVIGAGFMPAQDLAAEIAQARALTDRPFGVDILFGKSAGGDPVSAKYRALFDSHVAVVLDARVPVLVSGLGNPMEVIPEAHARGMCVMSVVGTVAQAVRLAAAGVDMIIASGADGGGHVGRVGTAVLVPAVADAVSIPVIAGGGLADGRGLAAALAWGAAGVWMGTRFIAATEAAAHQNYKQRIVDAGDDDTVVTRGNTGKPSRLLRNALTESWAADEGAIRPYPEQLERVGLAATDRGRCAGDVAHGALPAGQSVALIRDVKPARQILEDIVAEAQAALDALGRAAGKPV
jgi:enoyl-[acyl-carrier protein] reductase II